MELTKPTGVIMKKSFRILTLIAGIALASQAVFADGIDKWLDKYENFVEQMEKSVKNKQYSKTEDYKKQHSKLMDEKERVQQSEGDFTVKQSFRIAGLNTRYGVAIAALETEKGTKKAADAISDTFEEEDDSSSKKDKKKKK